MPSIGMTFSNENYLSSVYALSEKLNRVRSIDVARELNVTRPSVTHAIKALIAQGLLLKEGNGALHLTNRGRAAASVIDTRREALGRFFDDVLGEGSGLTEDEKRIISYWISENTIQAIKDYLHKDENRYGPQKTAPTGTAVSPIAADPRGPV